MSFEGGGTREGPEAWSKISRRNFWPGSVRRTPGRLRYTTLADMLSNEIPLRERRKLRPQLGWRPTLPEWDRGGDRLSPRPPRRYRFDHPRIGALPGAAKITEARTA